LEGGFWIFESCSKSCAIRERSAFASTAQLSKQTWPSNLRHAGCTDGCETMGSALASKSASVGVGISKGRGWWRRYPAEAGDGVEFSGSIRIRLYVDDVALIMCEHDLAENDLARLGEFQRDMRGIRTRRPS